MKNAPFPAKRYVYNTQNNELTAKHLVMVHVPINFPRSIQFYYRNTENQ